MEATVTKRTTILLDDDVHEALLARAGSERKISETINPLLRQALKLAQPPDVLEKLDDLERQLQALRAQVSGPSVKP